MFMIRFEDTGEVKEIAPVRFIPGRPLYQNGVVVDRGPATPVFNIPGYTVFDDGFGGLVARKSI